jgi:hypothetical protein
MVNSALDESAFICALDSYQFTDPVDLGDTELQGSRVDAVTSNERKAGITPQDLAEKWGIGLKTAADTLAVTTQMGYRKQQGPFTRRYRTEQQQLRYQRLACTVYTDTMFSKVKSQQGSTCGQLFLTDFNFVHFFGLTSKANAHLALSDFFARFGVPRHLHSDNAKELTTQKEWRKVCKKHAGIRTTTTEPHSPWQNLAEMGIKHLKTHVHRMMRKRNAPASLWEWATCYFALIKSNTASSIPRLKVRTPHDT